MMHVSINSLSKKFGSFSAVSNVSFEIKKGKLIGLLGPSGGGKTTILRLLAGLEYPDSGEIYIHGERVNDYKPQKRQIGFVFQNYALFRHMSVFDNIAFGLHVQKRKKSEIKTRVRELLELTDLEGVEKRLPGQLSGGQRQRVAFARALAPEPQLLLLDEPFAAIDAKVRKELRTWLKDMNQRLGVTTIFVTHDQEEAVEIADEIIIVNKGQIEQMGTPVQIYNEPATPFVASFVGESNYLDSVSQFKGFPSEIKNAKAIIRPEFVEIGRKNEITSPYASETGEVKHVFFRGDSWQIDVQVGETVLFGFRSVKKDPLKIGEKVLVLIHKVYIFDGKDSSIMGNNLLVDPMPVYI
ncbi:sulfate ABC transporter, ATP-binding protein CysA [Chitinispirillum alkaliphilum]|nr:sulfate ABC transporter, ATP-binding protein CysA [Chitinispirillum alkaliphilum]